MVETVDQFLDEHDDFQYVREGTKVQCTLTGQDFPPRLPLLEEYIRSKSYKKKKAAAEALAKKDASKPAAKKDDVKKEESSEAKAPVVPGVKKIDLDFDYSIYAPHITQHKKMKNALFCNLTASNLNKIPFEVEKHVNGKRFKRAKAEFEKMVEDDVSVSEEEEEDEEEDSEEAAAVDFDCDGPEAKRRKVGEGEMETLLPKEGAEEKASSSSAKKAGNKKDAKKADNISSDDKKETTSSTTLSSSTKMNKKQKAKAAAASKEGDSKTEEKPPKKAGEQEKKKKEKTAAEKRKVNSKHRKRQAFKAGGEKNKDAPAKGKQSVAAKAAGGA
ncbi:unnamed protein product [Amoebophrya sp. A25]|nr:unnamed protein product [Amoebophrya sp. A25]|eukprot:GSA25T00010113001.1